MSVPSRPVAILAMLGSAACWGGATVMTKGALQAFDPFVLLVVQLGTSVTALWIAVVLTATRLPDRRRMTRAGATGLLEPGLAYAIGVPGLALTTAGNASVIAALEPVFIFIGVWLVFGTRLGLRACLAVAVAVAGVVLVSSGGGEGPGDGSVAGDGMVVLATILAAAYVLASSRLAASMSSVLLPALQQTVGLGLVLVLTAAALLAGWQSLPTEVTTPVVLLAAASGLVQYALAFWLYIVSMKALPAGIAGMFLTTTPIFGVLGGVIILGESFFGGQVLGMTLVIAALIALLGSKDARQV